jgi:glycine cleavage system T protein (aminomethyltransferase)
VPASVELKRTPLYDRHVRAGARMVDFAGWEMPVQYEGVRQEHLAVRSEAGLFDVSHMGEIETRGPAAGEFLRYALTNHIEKAPPGGAQYSLLCREDGGVLDDLFTYRFPAERDERFITIVNASNAEGDYAWMAGLAREWADVEVLDRSGDFAMLALQGPAAIALLEPHLEGELPARFRFHEAQVAGEPALVCRTGYTGEDGVELLLAPDGAETVWDALIAAGATPAGLGARDTLRLEVCYPLYGNELTTDRTPIEAGLSWACVLDKDFVGADRLREQAERGTAEKLVPFRFTERGIPRTGCAILSGEDHIGVVTSGTLSPSLEVGIGMGYVRADLAEAGTEIVVDVRGKRRRARVASKPLYEKKGD